MSIHIGFAKQAGVKRLGRILRSAVKHETPGLVDAAGRAAQKVTRRAEEYSSQAHMLDVAKVTSRRTLFHGTDSRRVPKIMANGLLSATETGDPGRYRRDWNRFAYLTDDKRLAKGYASSSSQSNASGILERGSRHADPVIVKARVPASGSGALELRENPEKRMVLRQVVMKSGDPSVPHWGASAERRAERLTDKVRNRGIGPYSEREAIKDQRMKWISDPVNQVSSGYLKGMLKRSPAVGHLRGHPELQAARRRHARLGVAAHPRDFRREMAVDRVPSKYIEGSKDFQPMTGREVVDHAKANPKRVRSGLRRLTKQAARGGVVFDFDGVINPYTKGWQGVDNIPEAPRPEAVKLIAKLKAQRVPMVVASARANSKKGKRAIEAYLKQHGLPAMKVFPKPHGVVYVDDRGYKHKSWRATARAIAAARG